RLLISPNIYKDFYLPLAIFWPCLLLLIIAKSQLKTKAILLFFLCSYLPFSGLVYVPAMRFSLFGDRWVYLMIIPLSMLFGQFLTFLKNQKQILPARLLALTLIVLSLITSFTYSKKFNDHVNLLKYNLARIDALSEGASIQKKMLLMVLLQHFDNNKQYAELYYHTQFALSLFPNDKHFAYILIYASRKLDQNK